MTTTYDYGAPLKESGGVGEKYAAVKGIGEIIEKFGNKLVRSQPISFRADNAPESITIGVRESTDGTRFLFFLNKDREERFERLLQLNIAGDQVEVDCRLDALDSKMLVLPRSAVNSKSGQWYPKAQVLPARPEKLPAPIRIQTAYKRHENYRGQWQVLPDGLSLPELSVNDCRYVMYRSNVTLTAQEVEEYRSFVFHLFTGDPVYLQINGKLINRLSASELDNTFLLDNVLRVGKNELMVIYENRGHAHGYRPMEELSGLKQAGFGGKQSDIIPIEEWYVTPIGKEQSPQECFTQTTGWEKIVLNQKTIDNLSTLQIAGLEKPEWPAAWILQEKAGQAVYRTIIRWTPEMIEKGLTVLEFGRIEDWGTLWVNGKEMATHDQADEPFIVNLASAIKPGDNTIHLAVTNYNGAGGVLKSVRLKQEVPMIKPVKWEVSTNLGGISQGWINDKMKRTSDWSAVRLSSNYPLSRKGSIQKENTTAKRDALLTWYRIEFDLPASDPTAWIPWKMIVNATGTGYMWLNGHNIGRYWEEGPQREFYLPECWLHMGTKNVVVLGLRQSESDGAQLLGAEIAPYPEDAEIIKQ